MDTIHPDGVTRFKMYEAISRITVSKECPEWLMKELDRYDIAGDLVYKGEITLSRKMGR